MIETLFMIGMSSRAGVDFRLSYASRVIFRLIRGVMSLLENESTSAALVITKLEEVFAQLGRRLLDL